MTATLDELLDGLPETLDDLLAHPDGSVGGTAGGVAGQPPNSGFKAG